MKFELNVLTSILKLTRNGQVPYILISKDANLPSDVTSDLLAKMQLDGLIVISDGLVDASESQRARLAISAIEKGSDPVQISLWLSWQEFEAVSSLAFEATGYAAIRNVRFKGHRRRWELDIVGYKSGLVVCADCKHWHRGLTPSILRTAVSEQVARTDAFIGSVVFQESSWAKRGVRVIPILLSVFASQVTLFNSTPVVPVFMLRDFLDRLPAHLDSVLWIQAETKIVKSTSELAKTSPPGCRKTAFHKLIGTANMILDNFTS